MLVLRRLIIKIFLSLVPFLLYGQNLDTINWGRLQLVTDLELNTSNPCLIIDTITYYHACGNWNEPEIEVVYKIIPADVCDSVNSLSKIEKYRYLVENLYDKWLTATSNRIVKDKFYPDSLIYSPEILFTIQIGQKEKMFSAYKTNHSIELEELKKGIYLKERIPNAYRNFGDTKFELIFNQQNGTRLVNVESFGLNYFDMKKIINENLSSISACISNSCRDSLWMNFEIK